VSTFTPDPDNLRVHTARSLAVIEDAIQAAGFSRSIVIDEGNMILAGNGATEAAASVGLTKAVVVDAGPDTLVAVRRRGLNDKQKRHLAIADNRANELSTFDGPKLRAALDTMTAGDDDLMAKLGFRKDDLASMSGRASTSDGLSGGTEEGERCPRCRRLQ